MALPRPTLLAVVGALLSLISFTATSSRARLCAMLRPTPPIETVAVPGLEVAGIVAPLIPTLMSILAPPTTTT